MRPAEAVVSDGDATSATDPLPLRCRERPRAVAGRQPLQRAGQPLVVPTFAVIVGTGGLRLRVAGPGRQVAASRATCVNGAGDDRQGERWPSGPGRHRDDHRCGVFGRRGGQGGGQRRELFGAAGEQPGRGRQLTRNRRCRGGSSWCGHGGQVGVEGAPVQVLEAGPGAQLLDQSFPHPPVVLPPATWAVTSPGKPTAMPVALFELRIPVEQQGWRAHRTNAPTSPRVHTNGRRASRTPTRRRSTPARFTVPTARC